MKKEQDPTTHQQNQMYGFVIKLYRWMVNTSLIEENVNFDYMVWGYFDHMNIQKVSSLKDFYQNADGEKYNVNYMRFESQRMCLYTDDPNGEQITKKEFALNHQPLPIIVITELKLNLDERSTRENRKIYRDQIINDLTEMINQSGTHELAFHCFSSLGYSDLVIIFRGRSYSRIMEIIKRFRYLSIVTAPSDQNNIIVKSTYSITGVNLNELDFVDTASTELSIRISLKSLTSLDHIANELRNSPHFKEASFHTVFGKYDLDVYCPHINPQAYIKLFTKEENFVLDPNSPEYQKHINYTNTRWMISEYLNPDSNREITNPYPDQPKNNGKIDDLVNICQFIVNGNIFSESINITLQRLLTCYIQIIQNEVSEKELTKELFGVFDDFLTLSLWSMGFDKSEQLEIRKSGKLSKPFDEPKKMDVDSFKIGIQLIFDVIQNRVHASRMIFEMPSYNAGLLDTSTKIAMMYSTIVENIELSLNKSVANKAPKNITTNFFTLFDHNLSLETHTLFPSEINVSQKQLISIHLNNASFYDFKHSIPYLFHEIGHALPSSNQERRNKEYAKALCAFIVQTILGKLLKNSFYGEMAHRFPTPLQDILNQIVNGIKNHIVGLLWKQFSSAEKNQNYKDFQKTFLDALLKLYTFDVTKIKQTYNQSIEALFAEQKNFRDQDTFQTFLELFNHRMKTFRAERTDTKEINIFMERLLHALEGDLSGNSIQVIENQWALLNEAIKIEDYRMISKIDQLIKQNYFDEGIARIHEYLQDPNQNNELNGVLEFLAENHLMENRKSSYTKINNKILTYLVDPINVGNINSIADFCSILFNDIFADFYMIKALNLNFEVYQDILINFSALQKYQPYLADYKYAIDIRRSALETIQIIETNVPQESTETDIDTSIETNTILRYFQDYINFVRTEETIHIDKLIKENPFLEKLRIQYQKNLACTINEQSFSNEIHFIESILE